MNAGSFSIRAVIIGLLSGTVWQVAITGIVLPLISGIVFWLLSDNTGKSLNQIKELSELWSNSTAFKIIDFISGLLSPLLGGYVAAFIAKTSEIKHALVVGILSIFLTVSLGIMINSLDMARVEWVWYSFVYWLLFLPSAMLGGYLRKRQKTNGQWGLPLN